MCLEVPLSYREIRQICSEFAKIFGERGVSPPLTLSPRCACGPSGPCRSFSRVFFTTSLASLVQNQVFSVDFRMDHLKDTMKSWNITISDLVRLTSMSAGFLCREVFSNWILKLADRPEKVSCKPLLEVFSGKITWAGAAARAMSSQVFRDSSWSRDVDFIYCKQSSKQASWSFCIGG